MRWQGRPKSDNVEDRRGVSGRGLAVGGGIGGLGVVIAILYFLLGGNPSDITQNLQVDQPSTAGGGTTLSPKDQEMGDFISTVLKDIENVWR
ncbi:MAG: neutral zinc metallopeptidase, partial [Candidatus Aminicenantales bacterium]